jgi:hypothetical protein
VSAAGGARAPRSAEMAKGPTMLGGRGAADNGTGAIEPKAEPVALPRSSESSLDSPLADSLSPSLT